MPQMMAREKHAYEGDFHASVIKEETLPTHFDFKRERQSPEHNLMTGFEPPVSIIANVYLNDGKGHIPNSQASYSTTCQTDCMFNDSLPVAVTSANLRTAADSNMLHCANLTRELSCSPRDFVDGPMRLPVSTADSTVPSMTQEFYHAKISTNISQIDNTEQKMDAQKAFGNLLSQSDASVLDLNLPSITAFFRDENLDKPLDDSFHKEERTDLGYDCMDQKTPQMSPISDHRASPNSHPSSPISLTELKPMNNSEVKLSNLQIQKFQSSFHNDIAPVHDTVDGFNFQKHAFQPYIADCCSTPYPNPNPNYYGELKQELVRSQPVPSLNSNPYYTNPEFYPSPAPSIAQRLPPIVPQTANVNISFTYQ
jgi:hypothetical protein